MVTLIPKNHVSPPLMHVFRAAHEAKDSTRKIDLRTEGGDRVIAGRRMRARHVITELVLRREVARDLDSLLNAISMESTVDMTDVPFVRKSILNFGLPDVARHSADKIGIRKIPEDIRTAIMNYEPRLEASSLQIEAEENDDPVEFRVRFVVRAELACDPVHVPVEFVADIVESGKIVVNRL